VFRDQYFIDKAESITLVKAESITLVINLN